MAVGLEPNEDDQPPTYTEACAVECFRHANWLNEGAKCRIPIRREDSRPFTSADTQLVQLQRTRTEVGHVQLVGENRLSLGYDRNRRARTADLHGRGPRARLSGGDIRDGYESDQSWKAHDRRVGSAATMAQCHPYDTLGHARSLAESVGSLTFVTGAESAIVFPICF